MAKRQGSEQNRFGGSLNHKKPKLDISVQRRNDINFGASTSKSTLKKFTSNPLPSNIWNDDDDDDLLIISQMVEKKITNDICTTNTDMFDNISITFEHFGNHLKSSTQMPTQNQPMKQKLTDTTNQESSLLFDDFDFDWDEGNLKNLKDNEKNVFKRPSLQTFDTAKQKSNSLQTKLMSLKTNVSTSRDLSESNSKSERQDAIEVDKLVQTLDQLQSENKQQLEQIKSLSEQINDLTEKIHTKEGEASILRHELRTSKQTLDTLRIQKISENDNIRKEYQCKITELERLRNSIQAELNQKKIENVELKQKNACGGNSNELIKKYQYLTEINQLNFWFGQNLNIKPKTHLPNEIFLEDNSMYYNNVDIYFKNKFEQLCSLVAQYQLTQSDSKQITKLELIFNDLLDKVIIYLETNPHKFNKTIETDLELYESSDPNCINFSKSLVEKKSPFGPNKLSQYEKIVYFRRCLAVISYILDNNLGVKAIKIDSIEPKFKSILEFISTSSYAHNFMGVLESIGMIFTTLARTENFKENYIKYLCDIMYCLPNLRVMAEISDCLQEISKKGLFLDKLCTKSPKFNITYSGNKKIIKIPKTGCVLQTFCTILEFKILNLDKYFYKNIFELQKILESFIKLLGNCYRQYPLFMTDPNFNKNSTETSHRNSFEINYNICNCYANTCCNFVLVFYYFLDFWSEQQNLFEIEIVKDLCFTGTTLLCDIFYSYYQPVIFFIGKMNIKQNLFLILNCLEKNKEVLNIDYENFLKNIRESSIFTDADLTAEESCEKDKQDGNKILEDIFTKKSFFN